MYGGRYFPKKTRQKFLLQRAWTLIDLRTTQKEFNISVETARRQGMKDAFLKLYKKTL